MKRFIIDKSSRLSEEILEEKEFGDENQFKFSLNRKCENKNNEDDFFIPNSTVCWHCYYREFAEMMKSEVKKSKRKDFLIHQLNLRKHPNQFLRELSDLVVDNKRYFDEKDYSTSRDYLDGIKLLEKQLTSNLSEKTNAVLKYLYDRRETGKFYDLDSILHEIGFRSSKQENFKIGEILELNDLAKVVKSKDGVSAEINANGVLYLENDQLANTSEHDDKSQNFEELLHYIDLKFADLTVELNLNASELADLIEDLKQEFKNFAKPSLTRLVRMRLAEYFMSESVKEGAVRPLLRDIAESILEQ